MFLFAKKKPEVTTLEESTLNNLSNANRDPINGGRVNEGADLVEAGGGNGYGTTHQPDITQSALASRTLADPSEQTVYDRDELNTRRWSTFQPGSHPERKVRGSNSWTEENPELDDRRHRRTVIGLVVVVGGLILALVMLLTVAKAAAKTCGTKECVVAAGDILSALDRTADPCDEFGRFTCGGWRQRHPEPPGAPGWDRFSVMSRNVHYTLAQLLDAPRTVHDNTAVNISKTFYKACTDQKAWDSTGLGPLVSLVDRLGGFPLAHPNWTAEGYDWLQVVGDARRLMYSSFVFQVLVMQDEKNSSKYSVHIAPGSLPTPYQYVLSNSSDVRAAELRRILATVTALSMGGTHGPPSEREIKDIEKTTEEEVEELMRMLDSNSSAENRGGDYDKLVEVFNLYNFIYEITLISTEAMNSTDMYAFYNPVTVAQLQGLTDGLPEEVTKIDWLQFLTRVFSDTHVHLSSEERLVLASPVYVGRILALLTRTSSRVVANFLGYMIALDLSSEVSVMPKEIPTGNNTSIDKHTTLPGRRSGSQGGWPSGRSNRQGGWPSGRSNRQGGWPSGQSVGQGGWPSGWSSSTSARDGKYFAGMGETRSWMECAEKANVMTNPGATYLYVTATVSAKQIDETKQIADDLHDALRRTLQTSSWMDTDTKLQAQQKLTALLQLVGFDADNLNVTKLETFYEGLPALSLSSTNHFGNHLNLLHFLSNHSLAKLKETPERDAFAMPAVMINAAYSRQQNAMLIPVGILAPPFFRVNTIPELNYGAVGSIIGHEMMHGFDNEGKSVDAAGNLRNWWSPESSRLYEEKAQCYARQYNALGVNGDVTLPENIADNAGLNLAYNAFKHRSAVAQGHLSLPGLQEYTPEQLFFISYGQLWCANYAAGGLAMAVLTGDHTPAPLRVAGVIANSPAMKKAFSCPKPANQSGVCKLW